MTHQIIKELYREMIKNQWRLVKIKEVYYWQKRGLKLKVGTVDKIWLDFAKRYANR